MTPQYVLDLFGEAFWTVVMLVSMIVLPSLLMGLVIATFQAATQINEQTLSFLPRLLVIIFVIMIMGPWMVTKFTDVFRLVFDAIPIVIGL
ncbi:MAG: flagellar biosynthesis protein FliQ [Pseudomonadales bacterium]|nr:flagellar biosynthesis protein FliQ [Pseudomonadales bacterium]